jgi:hypothetical protein
VRPPLAPLKEAARLEPRDIAPAQLG